MEQRRYACDACRRRKVRCDGDQPCVQCARNGVSCTYGSTIIRQSSAAYAKSLEEQVAQLQRQMQLLTNPTTSNESSSNPLQAQQSVDLIVNPEENLVLEQATGRKVYSSTAALNVLRTIVDMLESGNGATHSGKALVQALEDPADLPEKKSIDWLDALLPEKAELWVQVNAAVDVALICHDCIDMQSIRLHIDTLPAAGSSASRPILAVIYGLLALGSLYGESEYDGPQTYTDVPAGLTYFRASRCITRSEHEPADLDTVTAIWLQSRYLMSASNFSDAYAILAEAITAALGMGLHLNDTSLHDSFSDEELFRRRCVFAILHSAEVACAYSLGIPRMLHSADSRQTVALTDQEWFDGGQALLAQDATTVRAETVLHQKLQTIFAAILEHQFNQSADLSSDWIQDVENELEAWERYLPPLSGTFAPDRILRGQLYLRLFLAAAHIFLYAPYLHHLGRQRTDPAWNLRGYEYGSACLRGASQAIILMETLHHHKLLNRRNWVNTRVLAWTATVLTYFVMKSAARVTVAEGRRVALKAFELLQYVGTTNLAAKKIYEHLSSYVDIVATIDG